MNITTPFPIQSVNTPLKWYPYVYKKCKKKVFKNSFCWTHVLHLHICEWPPRVSKYLTNLWLEYFKSLSKHSVASKDKEKLTKDVDNKEAANKEDEAERAKPTLKNLIFVARLLPNVTLVFLVWKPIHGAMSFQLVSMIEIKRKSWAGTTSYFGPRYISQWKP